MSGPCCKPSRATPNFNLTCAIFSPGADVSLAPRLTSRCQLYNSNYVPTTITQGGGGGYVGPTYLLLPRGTDIRGTLPDNADDLVQCPAGTDRYYTVDWTDDVSKGFPNEFRIARLSQVVSNFPPLGAVSCWSTPHQ